MFKKCLRKALNDNATDPNYNVKKMATDCHKDRTTLYRNSIKHTGKSPSAHLEAERLKKAKNLLRNTELPISQVAYQSGYSDASYFTKLFGKRTKMNPSTYREKKQQ